VSVVAANANQDETVLENAPFGKKRVRETARMLRKILSDQGFSESCSASEEGFYFVAEGATELTIYYNAAGEAGDVGLLNCSRAIAHYGFALTLLLSKRTSALFVRDDG